MTRPEPYLEYRGSDVPWVDRVPAGWLTLPLYSVLRESKTPNVGMVESNLLSLSYGRIVPKDIKGTDGLLPESFETYQVVEPGDIVFRFTDLQNDKRSLRSALVGERGIITSAYAAVTPLGIAPEFAAYLMRSYDTTKVFYGLGGGVRQSLKFDDVRRLPVLVPPLDEQRAIVDYLDRETAQIDALMGKQERLIETLRERRAAVVEAAFLSSPGLALTRVRNLLAQRPSYGVLVPTYQDEGVRFVRVGDLGRLTPEMSLPSIPETQSAEFARTRLQGGEILLGVVGNMGKSVVAPDWLAGANVARAVAVLRCRADVDAALLNRWFETRRFRDQATLSTGSDTAQPTLGMKDLAGFSLLWPTSSEGASRMASDLDEQTAKIDALIAKAERFIEVSKERRSALITAAVTGQIDVRERVGSDEAQVSV